ncbi:YfcL family protein [Pistricoccus aurantiacus]|nr:YfcL family protein [Pistricoccus aurantiacus]
MTDPLADRAAAIHEALRHMENHADEDQLFALGYLIPQVPLVMEMAEYEPENVEPEDFDALFAEWLEGTFAEDAMSPQDRGQILMLWLEACQLADAA